MSFGTLEWLPDGDFHLENPSTNITFLHQWDAKTVEVIGVNVRYIYDSRKTRRQNEYGSISLIKECYGLRIWLFD